MLMFVFLVVACVVIGIGLAAKTIQARHLATNQVVPGVATGAPDSWAGSHTREARLHRRLRDAMVAVVEHPGRDDPAFVPSRQELEQAALAIDQRLVAAAVIVGSVDADEVDRCEEAISGIEDAVRTLVLTTGATLSPQEVEAVAERVDYVAQARAELDRLYPTDVSAAGYEKRMRAISDQFEHDVADDQSTAEATAVDESEGETGETGSSNA